MTTKPRRRPQFCTSNVVGRLQRNAGPCNYDPLHEAFEVRDDRVLGRGTDGDVVEGICRQTRRSHALKRFSSAGMCNVEREIEILGSLDHPHIIKLGGVYRPTTTRRDLVLAFPLADCSFSRLLSSRGSLDASLSRKLLTQLLSALAYMHSNRVTHRDLKPDNLLITTDLEGQLQVLLCDFSRARRLPQALRTRKTTKTVVDNAYGKVNHRQLMTPGLCTRTFAAPEVVCGLEESHYSYGTAADMWSFGAIAFEAMFGYPFVSSRSDVETVAMWLCRLGAPDDDLDLGPRQKALIQASRRAAT